jgi:hypothetical protein
MIAENISVCHLSTPFRSPPPKRRRRPNRPKSGAGNGGKRNFLDQELNCPPAAAARSNEFQGLSLLGPKLFSCIARLNRSARGETKGNKASVTRWCHIPVLVRTIASSVQLYVCRSSRMSGRNDQENRGQGLRANMHAMCVWKRRKGNVYQIPCQIKGRIKGCTLHCSLLLSFQISTCPCFSLPPSAL